jgi:hypothetical protein
MSNPNRSLIWLTDGRCVMQRDYIKAKTLDLKESFGSVTEEEVKAQLYNVLFVRK